MEEIWVATKALVIHNRKVLLLQRSNYCGIGENDWEFPGGGLKFGEDLLSGLTREIKEEACINVCVKKLLYAISRMISPQKQVIGLTYLCSAEEDEVVLSNEHKAFLWATKAELTEKLNKPMLNDLMAYSVFDTIDIS